MRDALDREHRAMALASSFSMPALGHNDVNDRNDCMNEQTKRNDSSGTQVMCGLLDRYKTPNVDK